VKSITTFQSPPADNLYRLVEVHCVHNFEQPLLLWAVIAGLRAGLGRAEVGFGPCRAGPQTGLEIAGRAKNFRPVHIFNQHQAFSQCAKQEQYSQVK